MVLSQTLVLRVWLPAMFKLREAGLQSEGCLHTQSGRVSSASTVEPVAWKQQDPGTTPL